MSWNQCDAASQGLGGVDLGRGSIGEAFVVASLLLLHQDASGQVFGSLPQADRHSSTVAKMRRFRQFSF